MYAHTYVQHAVHATHLYKVIQSKQSELVLEMYTKVYVLCRVHYHIDEVHTGHLEIGGCVVRHEILYQFLEAVLFAVGLLEIIDGLKDLYVAAFDETNSG